MLIPLAASVLKTATLGLGALLGDRAARRARSPRTGSAFGASFAAALDQRRLRPASSRGCSSRYRFPGRGLVDALVDLPFALPTAVAGIALTTLLREERLARPLPRAARHPGRLHAARHHHRAHLHRAAVRRAHGAAGARGPRAGARGGRRDPRREPLADLPARDRSRRSGRRSLTGFALAFARALGEYGSVVFISGNMPMKTEITPLLIMTQARAVRLRRARPRSRSVHARRLVRAAARHQRAPGLERRRLSGGAEAARCSRPPPADARLRRGRARAHRGPAVGALPLIGVALALPRPLPRAAARRRLRRGAPRRASAPTSRAITEPTRCAAIRLTLLVAGDRPCRSTWSSASPPPGRSRSSSSPARALLITLIDLPFAVSPVVSGPDLRAALRRAGPARAVAPGARHQDHLRRARASCSRRSSSRSRSSRAS